MSNKCKCKEKNQYIIIIGKGIKCTKCNKWIGKVRSKFYKREIIKEDKTKYNRKREKYRFRKQLKEE